jgi:hypothetical protein
MHYYDLLRCTEGQATTGCGDRTAEVGGEKYIRNVAVTSFLNIAVTTTPSSPHRPTLMIASTYESL